MYMRWIIEEKYILYEAHKFSRRSGAGKRRSVILLAPVSSTGKQHGHPDKDVDGVHVYRHRAIR